MTWKVPEIDKQVWLDLDTAVREYQTAKWYRPFKLCKAYLKVFELLDKILKSIEVCQIRREQALSTWRNEITKGFFRQ